MANTTGRCRAFLSEKRCRKHKKDYGFCHLHQPKELLNDECICGDIPKTPYVLRCGHQFHIKCLKKTLTNVCCYCKKESIELERILNKLSKKVNKFLDYYEPAISAGLDAELALCNFEDTFLDDILRLVIDEGLDNYMTLVPKIRNIIKTNASETRASLETFQGGPAQAAPIQQEHNMHGFIVPFEHLSVELQLMLMYAPD